MMDFPQPPSEPDPERDDTERPDDAEAPEDYGDDWPTVGERISAHLREFMGREARFAYWQDGRGPMFVYNTERIRTLYGSPADGKFESAVFDPVGPGSRSGKAERWKERPDSRSAHTLRRDAKERAYRMYQEWRAEQC